MDMFTLTQSGVVTHKNKNDQFNKMAFALNYLVTALCNKRTIWSPRYVTRGLFDHSVM